LIPAKAKQKTKQTKEYFLSVQYHFASCGGDTPGYHYNLGKVMVAGLQSPVIAELWKCCIILQPKWGTRRMLLWFFSFLHLKQHTARQSNFELAWRINISIVELKILRKAHFLISHELHNRSHSQGPILELLCKLIEEQSSTPAPSLRSFR
jgi:hypothetical protein